TQLNHWPHGEDTTANYGAGYLFALYLWERFGDELIWDLAHHPADGMAALDAVLAAQDAEVTPEEVFADWVVVNAINSGEHSYVHEQWRGDIGVDARYSSYPVEAESTVHPYATDYVELTGRGTVEVSFWGRAQAELLPVPPHSGETAWWSNRGNRSDAHLIRHLDLAGLPAATLRFWTWYEIERRYDHVYLSASTDGGRSWQVVEGERSSFQGDYGPAYSGESGGWIEEEVDLSPYAGQEVWIRFDYVTDETINDAGFLVDDLSVPELELHDPCEDEASWVAQGFVLVGQAVPQRWIVQAITIPAGGGPAQVERMALNENQAGSMAVDLDDAERVLLAISATARGVTEPAGYRYRIVQR
ncbi:MAG: immune inhibitor A, partial [Anaerolineae bacterium]